MNEYKTVLKAADDEYIVKHSRFIGYCTPVKTQQEAVDFINSIKAKHWDAKHNVYAYCLREGQIKRFSDDGEPQGTAGMPTLDVILKEDVTDCCVVITRYFGGILLGGGGLVRAYSHTSKLALEASQIITMGLCSILIVECDYNFYGKLPSVVAQAGGEIIDSVFEDNVKVEIKIPSDKLPMFNATLTDISNGKLFAKLLREEYMKI
ncbi:MAG: YigZ family protein [Clostridiales bacterium]|nr:YigZ family protein [Clostridiales bacterium]